MCPLLLSDIGPNLVQSHVCLCLLSRSLWAQYISDADLEGIFFVSSIPSDSFPCLLPLLLNAQSPGRGGDRGELMNSAVYGWVFQGLSPSAYFLVVGLYICSYLLQVEASPMMAEQGTNLRPWTGCHFLIFANLLKCVSWHVRDIFSLHFFLCCSPYVSAW